MPETNDVISHLYYDLNDKIDNLDQRLDAIDVEAATEPKVYTALLTQTGTSAPVATVLENTLGGVPVWTYSGVGTYDVTLASAFPTSKTNIETTLINWLDSAIDNEDMFVKITKNSQSAYTIISYVNTSNTNGILNKFYFKIEVYP